MPGRSAAFAHAKQFKRMRKALREERTWVGRSQRELQRQLDQIPQVMMEKARELINLANRLLEQTRNARMKNKLYSLHEQNVDCMQQIPQATRLAVPVIGRLYSLLRQGRAGQ